MTPAQSVRVQDAALWHLPDRLRNTQSSFQLKYGGPDGGATPKLILRVIDEDRFTVQGSELGKRIFTLEVDQSKGLFTNHRNKTYCWINDEIDLSVLPLGSLPLSSLPLLLFDRLPLPAVSAIEQVKEELRFEDQKHRSWKVHLRENGSVESWTVSLEGLPRVWLQHDGRDSVLSAPDLQLRWRLGQQETLAIELDSLRPNDRYAEDCSEDGT